MKLLINSRITTGTYLERREKIGQYFFTAGGGAKRAHISFPIESSLFCSVVDWLLTLFSVVQLTEIPENIPAEIPISTKKMGKKSKISYIKWFTREKSGEPPVESLRSEMKNVQDQGPEK